MSLRLHAATVALAPAGGTLAQALAEGALHGRTPDIEPEMRLPVATGSPVDLAAAAARELLARSGFPAGEVDDLYYAWTYFQGAHFWSPAHALADRAGLAASNPIGVQQMCNGAAAALHLANRAAAAGGRFAALIATGDAFRAPGFDRWSGDYGVLYGDAGTALLVVSADHPTPAAGPVSTLLALRSGALPQLESMHRPVDDPSDVAPLAAWPIDVQRTKKRYLQDHGSQSLATAMQGLLRKLLAEVTTDLRASGRELTGDIYLPRLLDATLDELYLPVIAEYADRPPLRHGRVTGHLGAGDLIANLAEVQRSAVPLPALGPSDGAVLLPAPGPSDSAENPGPFGAVPLPAPGPSGGAENPGPFGAVPLPASGPSGGAVPLPAPGPSGGAENPGARWAGPRVDLIVSAGAGFTMSVAAVETDPGGVA